MDRLRETTLPQGMANELRHRLVRGLLLSRGTYDIRSMRTSPTGRLMEERNARRLGSALSRFLLDLADQPPHLDATLGQAFVALWHDLNRDPGIPAVSLPLGEQAAAWAAAAGLPPGPDLWNLATVLDRYRDLRLVYPAAVDTRRAAIRGGPEEPIESFFSAPAESATGDTLALGVVCGIEPDLSHGRRNVLLNVGLGEPVTVGLTPREIPSVGELRAVHLSRPDRAAAWTAHGIHELAASRPRPGERRRAVVSALAEFPWLRVTVDGEDVYPASDSEAASMIRMAWDPDLTRGLAARSGAADPAPGPVGEGVTLAYFDEDLDGWLPVDRGLTELLGTLAADVPAEMAYGGRDIDERARVRWRLTTSPGYSYLLSAADWANADVAAEALAGNPVGLRVHAGIDRATGLLVMLPDAEGSFGDDRNWRWSQLFAEATEFMAVPDAGELITEVKPPTGLPRWIPVDGLAPTDTLFEVGSWTEYDQRRGRVRGAGLTSYYLENWDSPNRDRLRELRDIKQGDFVQLDRLLAFRPEGLSTARGQDGLTLSVETSSLSLLPLRRDRSRAVPVEGRRARVYRVVNRAGPPQQALAVPAPDLADALAQWSGGPTGLRDDLRSLRGAVVRRLQSRQAGHASSYWGVWLEIGSDVRYCEIPSSAFEIVPAWPGLGDLVTARRTESGWVFSAQCRSIRARATYRMVDSSAIPDSARRIVGYEIDGDEVIQDRRNTSLACIRPRRATARGAFERSVAAASVRPVGSPYVRDRPRQQVVAQFEDGSVIAGDTAPYDASGQVASVRNVRIRFTPVPETGGAEAEVEREFLCDLRPRVRAEDVSQVEIDHFQRLEENRKEIILTGALVPGGIRFGTAVRLPDGRYGWVVPRVPDDGPWIASDEGNEYGQSVRAVLVWDGFGYRASCRKAPPLSLAEFQPVLGAKPTGSSARYATPAHFRYVGASSDSDGEVFHSFEWGHGWTVRIPDGRLRRPTVAGRALGLFHGDRIIAVTLFRIAGEFMMAFDPASVRLGLPGRVYEEARTHVVHQLRVEIDPEERAVRVRSVLTGRREFGGRRQAQASHKSLRAQLTRKSVERLLATVSPVASRRPVIRDVLARLDQSLVNDLGNGQGRRVDFVYIPASPEQGDPVLHKGDRLFLMSGRIRPTRNGNDVFMQFTPPGDFGTNGSSLNVEVSRRDFSYRQDVLPRLLASQEADQPAESQIMTVMLKDPPANDKRPWRGVTKWPPSRSASQLATFLAMQKERSCLATLGEDEHRRPGLEVEPGVVFETRGISLPVSAEPGAVVRLALPADQKGVDAELAIPSDLSYLPEGPAGRAAVVMPKTPLLWHEPRTLLTTERQTRDYTIAGLPGIEATTAPALSAELMRSPHPKTALVVRNGTRVDIAERKDGLTPGRLVANPHADAAVVVPLRGADLPQLPIDWAQVSFADIGIERIAKACHRKSFPYGDALTGHWAADTDGHTEDQDQDQVPSMRFVPTRLRGRDRAYEVGRADEVVLVSLLHDERPTLRHSVADLRRFGFPVAHLVDVLASATTPQEREFTVAGVAYGTHGSKGPRGLWLEIRPGHMAEVIGAMLTDADGHPVDELSWEHFAAGDRVVLSADTADPRSVGSIRLERWRPGPRAGFALRDAVDRVLLPVGAVSTESGSISLGAGRARVVYPAGAAVRAAFPAGTAAWLTADNRLAPPGPPRPGDTVLLGSTGGQLVVHGMRGATAELAEAGWPDAWIRDALADEHQRETLLDLAGKALPVTVEAVPTPDHVVVSRRRQPAGKPSADSLLWARFLGSIETGGGRRLVFDSGGALFALRPEVLVPGAPPQSGAGVGLRDARAWLHTDGSGHLYGGRPATAGPSDEMLVVAERAVELGDCGGLICREKETSAYRWLPAAEASWCDASASDLAPHLRGRELRVTLRKDGTVSLIDAAAVRTVFAGLTLGATHRIEYLAAGQSPAGLGLGRIHLSEMIVGIGKLDRIQLAPGTSLLAEVAQRRTGDHPRVLMVPQGRRRIILDLPPSLTLAMRRLSAWNPEHDGPAEIPELWRFGRYRDALTGNAIQDGEPAPAEEIISAARQAYEDGTLSPDASILPRLSEWLAAQESAEEIDLAPTLAACLVLHTQGTTEGDAVSAQAAVRYLHFIGRCAERSMHVEALARRWLGRPDRWHFPGVWERLRRLLWVSDAIAESDADPRELDDDGPIHDLARTVLQRIDPRKPLSDPTPTQSPLAPVARALLAAVGSLDNGENWLRDAPVLARVAGLGRGLTPAAGRPAAQHSLLDCQRQALEGLFLQVTRSGQPYVLLPPVRI